MKKPLAPNTREDLDKLRQQLDYEFVSLLGMIGIAQEPREHGRDFYLELRHRMSVIAHLLEQIDGMLAIQWFLEDPTSTNAVISKIYQLLEEEGSNVKRKSNRRNILSRTIRDTEGKS